MNVSLTQAAAALNANTRWQETITENLASSSVPGYRKQDLSFSTVQAGLLSAPVSASGSNSSTSITYPQATTTTNFQSGEMVQTGVSTHLAISGNGFFEVETGNGTTAYTRCGQFRVDAQGKLVNSAGYTVMGENGPLQLDASQSGQITVSSQGDVSQGTENRGKIKLTEFSTPGLLTSAGKGYFVAENKNLVASPATNSSLNQGYLEGSNTSPVNEMANLITAMRAYEANQRVIQLSDERTSRAINDLGNPA
jgi:flagellar basal-body rod protein FlgF